MQSFEALRLPVLTSTGDLLSGVPAKISFNGGNGSLSIPAGSDLVVLDLREVCAVEIGEEKEVAAIGKTIGRMALSGIGSALFSKGRRGGVGAGLLDLSIRGVETKSVVSGVMVFANFSIVKFAVSGDVFQRLMAFMPRESFEADAIVSMRERLELIGRMKGDGRRVMEELLTEIVALDRESKELRSKAEDGETFAARDRARQTAREVDMNLHEQKTLFKVLLVENGMSFRAFAATFAEADAASNLFDAGPALSSAPSTPPSPAPPQAGSEHPIKALNSWMSRDDKLTKDAKMGLMVGCGMVVVWGLKHLFF